MILEILLLFHALWSFKHDGYALYFSTCLYRVLGVLLFHFNKVYFNLQNTYPNHIKRVLPKIDYTRTTYNL